MMPTRSSILLVDDDAATRFGLGASLASRGFEVREAATAAEALAAFQAGRPDAMVIDYLLPDGTALDVVPQVRALDPRVLIVLLTAYGSIDLAVDAVKAGADQFLTKPVDLDSLGKVVQNGLESRRQRQNAAELPDGRQRLQPFLGVSSAVRALERSARKLAAADSPVLLLGEAGTGKRELARWLHENSRRASATFVELRCAGLSRQRLESELFGHEKGAFRGARGSKAGLLELADRGTVFLDEIADVDPLVQPKILKALEDGRFRRLGSEVDRPVDFRLIAATRHDLGRMAQENKFRSDLYFQMNTIPLLVPPLRQRRQDLPVLARALVEELAWDFGRRSVTLAPEAESALLGYGWPGNTRELRSVLERAVLLNGHGAIREVDLHALSAGSLPAPRRPAAGRLARA